MFYCFIHFRLDHPRTSFDFNFLLTLERLFCKSFLFKFPAFRDDGFPVIRCLNRFMACQLFRTFWQIVGVNLMSDFSTYFRWSSHIFSWLGFLQLLIISVLNNHRTSKKKMKNIMSSFLASLWLAKAWDNLILIQLFDFLSPFLLSLLSSSLPIKQFAAFWPKHVRSYLSPEFLARFTSIQKQMSLTFCCCSFLPSQV